MKKQEKIKLFEENKKQCTKCTNIKELKDFVKQKAGFMGYKAQCRECDYVYDKNFQNETNYRNNRDKKDSSKKYRKKYIDENKDWWRKYEREYRKNRRQFDMFFKIKSNLSSRLSDLINKRNISLNTLELIGCDEKYFLKYIEEQFIDGMNWSNYGIKGWHIDHKLPLSSFDLTSEEEVKKACNYKNLQPMWWYDNLEKGNKII